MYTKQLQWAFPPSGSTANQQANDGSAPAPATSRLLVNAPTVVVVEAVISVHLLGTASSIPHLWRAPNEEKKENELLKGINTILQEEDSSHKNVPNSFDFENYLKKKKKNQHFRIKVKTGNVATNVAQILFHTVGKRPSPFATRERHWANRWADRDEEWKTGGAVHLPSTPRHYGLFRQTGACIS